MMKMSKIFLLTLIVCLLGCGGSAKDVAAASETPMPPKMPPSETLSLDEPIPPKGLVERGGQIFITGYNHVPVVLDSYGVWRDEDGNEMTRKQVREIFKDLPDYGYAVMRFNEDLTELMTKKRTKVLTRFQKYVAPAKEPVDGLIMDKLERDWRYLAQPENLSNLLSPKANGAYELCNEIMELEPESVPLILRDETWYDQDLQKMSSRDAEQWLEAHPRCGKKLLAINEANGALSNLPILSDTVGVEIYLAFREAYVESRFDTLATMKKRSEVSGERVFVYWDYWDRSAPIDLSRWNRELTRICDERGIKCDSK